MKIMDLCESERPREKMKERGASALDNVELLAVIMRTGYLEDSAIDLARKIWVEAAEKLSTLSQMSIAQLERVPGVGPGKAAGIAAAFELGRRFLSENLSAKKMRIDESAAVYSLMIPHLKGLDHEECWAVFLNNSLYYLDVRRMSSGGLDSTTFDIKAITRAALDLGSNAVILIHNHPSGDPRPGKMDLECTGKLKGALTSFDIRLLEHLVFCDDCYYSFAEEKLCEAGRDY